MKALAIAAACLLLCQPAQALVRVVAGHGGGFHHAGGHRGSGLVLDGGYFGPVATPAEVAPSPAPASAALSFPFVIAAPQPLCPMPAGAVAAPPRPSGPHIIYIGQKPEIHGPKVIYGTE